MAVRRIWLEGWENFSCQPRLGPHRDLSSGNDLKNEGLRVVVEALCSRENAELTYLSIDNNKVDEEGMREALDMLHTHRARFPRLCALSCSENTLGVKGLAPLVKLMEQAPASWTLLHLKGGCGALRGGTADRPTAD